jgi:hypothetical protein
VQGEIVMDERERFDAQREAQRESAGEVSRSTRERIMAGLAKYLSAEAAHIRRSGSSTARREKPEKRQDGA